MRQKYREEFAHCGRSMDYAGLRWHRYLSAGTDLTSISTLEKRIAVTRPASPITTAAAAGVEISARRLLASSAVPDDE